MGNQFVWQDRFNIGVESIDKEHKKLFSIINRLLSYDKEASDSQWVLREGIKYFKDHALKHFTKEEAYMASIYHGGFETHRRIHNDFRLKTLPALERELENTGYSPEAVDHFIGVCTGWLIGHTLTEDQAIVGKGVSRWQELLPSNEQAALQRVIVNLLDELFQLNAKVLSESYGGERFGKGIYYRLVYGAEDGKNWEVILVFEERLLTGTVGKLLGGGADKLDTMIMNATRYTARQFMTRIGECFSDASLYDVKSENLLTYDQFQKIFEENRLQSSLLFDTGEGYFAYCAIAPHLLKDKIGSGIETENAMSEVGNYLKKADKENQKKKILVVDDSKFSLAAMKELLEQDYEVSLAQSGISAIQCISLNRPHLILLDYDMPICDGRQVLQMIRSEQDFANIPVIFLTGRVDKESILKVKPLNPAGYLLKTLNPVEIKKNIDAYFKNEK
ncbi:hemerythrin domain-containing protein [Lachnospiraceae bacterium 29-84]